MPPELYTLQRAFQRAVTDPGASLGALARLVAGDVRRVGVYREAYFARLVEVIGGQHPALGWILGDELPELIERYLGAHPPRAADIGEAGDRLPGFLARQLPARPWLAELARLERLHVRLFGAADAEPLTTGELLATPPDELAAFSLRAVPASALLACGHDVAALWSAPMEAVVAAPTRILVWRAAGSVWHRVVDATEWRALAWLGRGGSIAELAEVIADGRAIDDAAAELYALLVRWSADQLICR